MVSIDSHCEAMSVVAATLANGGICPLKPQEGTVVDGEAVQHTLSLMHSCGMYDFSGQFAFKVGVGIEFYFCFCTCIFISDVNIFFSKHIYFALQTDS